MVPRPNGRGMGDGRGKLPRPKLRNESTDPEILLWNYLRLRRLNRVRFRRQHAIGRYVVDFCAPDEKLIIELDGSQHIQQVARDSARTKYLEAQGYRVLRFWNDQVLKDINGVVSAIQDALSDAEGA
jgi:very-short-patch-repair endonuclease